MLASPVWTQPLPDAFPSSSAAAVDESPHHPHSRTLQQADNATAAAPVAPPATPVAPPATPVAPTAAAAVPVVVTTPTGLQDAAAQGSQDIEIQAHLDLRNLTRPPNPAFPPSNNGNNEWALLYALQSMRSIRGNCADPDAAAALGLSPEDFDAAPLLPLKPRQCLLLVPGAFLMSNGGPFWLDNVYLRLLRTHAFPEMAFVRVGVAEGDEPFSTDIPADLFLTNITFQGEFRGSAQGVVLDTEGSSALVQDCIFTDWHGPRSPLRMGTSCVANVVDTVFRNMLLTVELADVSYDGLVRFQNTSLANVTLQSGKVVATTKNDYQERPNFLVFYYAMDDEEFDVDWEPVPIGERGSFGAEFTITEDYLGDCIFLGAEPGTIRPGCPASSVQDREAVLLRAQEEGSNRETGYGEEVGDGDGGLLPETVPAESTRWLVNARAALPPLPPPPPAWPPFAVDPPRWLDNRTELSVLQPVPRGLLVPALEETAAAVAAAEAEVAAAAARAASGRGKVHGAVIVAAVVAALALLAVAAVAWAVLALRRRPLRAGGDARAERQRRRMRDWMWAGETSATGTHASGVTPAVSDRGSSVPPGRQNNSLPQGAMNPAYEYALPTEVARLMGAPILETEEQELLEALKVSPAASSAEAGGGGAGQRVPGSASGTGRGISTRDLRMHTAMPSLAATQPSGVPAQRGLSLTDGSGGRGSVQGSNTEPLAGAASVADAREASLHAESDEPGSTIVVAPYDLTNSTRSAGTTIAAPASHVSGTVDGTISSATTGSRASFTTEPPPPGAAAAPLGQQNLGIRMGGMHDSDAAAAPRAPAGDVVRTSTDVGAGDPRIRRLHRLLDGFGEHDLFLGRFEMLGREHRRRGGQAIVQFAEGRDRAEFAVKFFLDWDAFLTEAALYATAFPYIRSELSPDVLAHADAIAAATGDTDAVPMAQVAARFLPQVEAVCDGTAGGLEDPRGRPLPPCIVMEKGESLHDWSDRAEPDLFTSLAVLSNISKRLADMHDAGYVHRDLKPANVMWLPRANRWTVIDFGCVARIGEVAPLSFTLAYAAPEVGRAFCEQRRSIESAPALDAWSLGVMAYELLTGAPAFNLLSDGRVGVMRRLLGELPLPWEGELSAEVQRHLGMFKGPVLQLLERDPTRRATMHRFHLACTKLFAARTTVEA